MADAGAALAAVPASDGCLRAEAPTVATPPEGPVQAAVAGRHPMAPGALSSLVGVEEVSRGEAVGRLDPLDTPVCQLSAPKRGSNASLPIGTPGPSSLDLWISG